MKFNPIDSLQSRIFPNTIRALPEPAQPGAAPGLGSPGIRARPSELIKLTEAEARELKGNIVPMPTILETRPFYREGQEAKPVSLELVRRIDPELIDRIKLLKSTQRELRKLLRKLESLSFANIRRAVKKNRIKAGKGQAVDESIPIHAGRDYQVEFREKRMAVKENINRMLEDLRPTYQSICTRWENAVRPVLSAEVERSKTRHRDCGLPADSWTPDAVILALANSCWSISYLIGCGPCYPKNFAALFGVKL